MGVAGGVVGASSRVSSPSDACLELPDATGGEGEAPLERRRRRALAFFGELAVEGIVDMDGDS